MTGRRVAVCMATYEPDPMALSRQVDSIRAQTHEDWHCWVVDDASTPRGRQVLADVLSGDERFTLVQFEDNVGFYRNFERALRRVQGEAPWISLADQDDIWAPHKLATLLSAACTAPAPRLVYADVEVRDSAGRLLSPTYWVGRRHNEQDLAALLFANTVTGAASLIAAGVVGRALPFPARYPTSFHDHWLALVARCTGAIVYVDETVQTYVQHAGNAIGHQPAPGTSAARVVGRTLLRAWWRRPERRYYDDEVARLSGLAQALLSRMPMLLPQDAGVLRAVASLHGTHPPVWWIAKQALLETRDPSITMWRRRRVLASVLWTRLSRSHGAGAGSARS